MRQRSKCEQESVMWTSGRVTDITFYSSLWVALESDRNSNMHLNMMKKVRISDVRVRKEWKETGNGLLTSCLTQGPKLVLA